MPFGTKQYKKAQFLTKRWAQLIQSLPTLKEHRGQADENGMLPEDQCTHSLEEELSQLRGLLSFLTSPFEKALYDREQEEMFEELIRYLEIEMDRRGYSRDKPHYLLPPNERKRWSEDNPFRNPLPLD